jgi:hypothetical protein
VKLTDLDAQEYLAALDLSRMTGNEDDRPTEVWEMDGGALWRVSDDHFVMLVCKDAEHPAHKGPAQLRRVLPAGWGVFYAAGNPAEQYEAHHYGPVDA